MKEQSHKDEMSAAIRGDFQRLRDRGVAATLAPQDPPVPAVQPVPEREPDAVVPSGAPAPGAPSAEDGADALVLAAEDVPTAEDASAAEPRDVSPAEDDEREQAPASQRPGWLSRLVGR